MFSENNFYSQDDCFYTFNDLITIYWRFDDWEKKQNLYLEWIALHCSCQISPTGGTKKIILLEREAWPSYLKMSTHRVSEQLKNMFEQKFLWTFIDFFCFYIPNSLEKQDENSGVLLNCQSGNIGVFLSYYFCTLLLKTGVFVSTLHHRY